MNATKSTATKTASQIAWEKARKPANDARKQNAQYQAAMRASYEPDGDDSWLDD